MTIRGKTVTIKVEKKQHKGGGFMQYDAINAGVNPGGLHSRTEIRVLICYILNNIASPVPLDVVKEQLHFEGIANFFEVSFAITELVESHHISVSLNENNKAFYTINDEGRNVAETLSKSLPQSVKDNALTLANRIVSRMINEHQNRVVIEKSTFGFYVNCTIMERDFEVASVKLLVPDEETALNVKERFLQNPSETLLNITSSLTGMKL